MQSTPAQGSELWSRERSGDHEETVQVAHAQRVCTQDKGTAGSAGVSLCYLCILIHISRAPTAIISIKSAIYKLNLKQCVVSPQSFL